MWILLYFIFYILYSIYIIYKYIYNCIFYNCIYIIYMVIVFYSIHILSNIVYYQQVQLQIKSQQNMANYYYIIIYV